MMTSTILRPHFRQWPTTLDSGAGTQFTLQEYCQPPARAYPAAHNEGDGTSDRPTDNLREGDQYIDVPKEFYDIPDLKVVLKTSTDIQQTYLVSSHSLCLASGVWRTFINQRLFRELENEEWGSTRVRVLEIEDDDPEVISLIFSIIHFRNEDVPSQLPFDLLHKVAVVCDKYDCGRSIRPWGERWLRYQLNRCESVGYESWMFIARVLEPSLMEAKKISQNLILETSSISSCGSYMLRQLETHAYDLLEHEVDLKFIPDNILEYIVKERDEAIRRAVTLLREFVGEISACDHSSNDPRSVCSNAECLDISIGSLMRNLKKLKLWPLVCSEEPHQWCGSVSDLLSRIAKIEMTTFIRKRQQATGDQMEGGIISSRSRQSGSGSSSGTRLPNTSGATTASLVASGQNVRSVPLQGPDVQLQDVEEISIRISHLASSSEEAVTTERLRFTKPAYNRDSYKDGYTPCESAFRLGKLNLDCHQVVYDIVRVENQEVESIAQTAPSNRRAGSRLGRGSQSRASPIVLLPSEQTVAA